MKGRYTAGGALVLLLSALAFGCGDNGGNPTGFAPNGTGDAALLLIDVQPMTADSSQVAVYADIYDPTSANGYRLYLEPGDGRRLDAWLLALHFGAPTARAMLWHLRGPVVDGNRDDPLALAAALRDRVAADWSSPTS